MAGQEPPIPPPTGGEGPSDTTNLFIQLSAFVENMMNKNKAEMEALITQKFNEKNKEKEPNVEDDPNHTQNPPKTPQVTYKTFKACGATEFAGKMDPIMAFAWLDNMEKVFEISFTDDAHKVGFATAMLTGEAHTWWKLESESIGKERRLAMKWEEFKGKFVAQFCPIDLQRKYEREFLNLVQGNMSVTAYAAEFQKKARFASVYIPNNEMKVRRFVEGLKWEIRELVLIQKAQTLEQAMEYAREREEALVVRDSENVPPPKRAHTSQSAPSFSIGRSTGSSRPFPQNNRSFSVSLLVLNMYDM